MNRLPPLVTRLVVAVVVLVVVVGGGIYLFSGSNDKTVTAEFQEAVGVYPGTPVKILGVTVGTVSKVHPEGGVVKITMNYGHQYNLPANVKAVTVANSLVSDRYLQLTPAWKSGAKLKNHGDIPVNDTAGPSELDDIYSALSTFSKALGPNGANANGALNNLVNVGAANLTGNGAALGTSITNLSAAAKTLADNRTDLFGTVKNLQVFTKALQSSDSQIRDVESQLAEVAGDLASERGDLGTALHTLAGALDEVANFVKTNAAKTHTDLSGLANIAQILVKEQSSLNETLAVGPSALANIVHAYQPDLGVLASRSNLGSLTDLGTVCTLLNGPAYLNGVITAVSHTLSEITTLLGGKSTLLGVDTTSIVSACESVFQQLHLGSPTKPSTKSKSSSSTADSAVLDPLLSGTTDGQVGGLILGG